jgi:sulfopyruvate decarboxylase TPP-binding subunit
MASNGVLRGTDIIAALKTASVGHVVSVPDITTSHGLLWPLSRDTEIKLIRLCKEDDGVSICAALAHTEKRAVLLMQMTGFLDSINCIRAVACEYKQPVCMMIGLLGKAPEEEPSESRAYGVRIIEPICDVMGIDHMCLNDAEDVAQVPAAIDRAYAASRPLAVLFGKVIEP